MTPDDFASDIGVGATSELSLRVSVATLVRVLFEHPDNGNSMLALERKATLLQTQDGPVVEVIAQPFGGAIQIRDPRPLRELVGGFRFDSEESRSERDFRIFIRPSDWEIVQGFCLQHLSDADDPVLETEPRRELAEEFADTLKMKLNSNQYTYRAIGTVVEDRPAPTRNIHARGHLTARVYRIFEARILDRSLSHTMLANSETYSNHDLQQLALKDARNGGRANAILAIPIERISNVYRARSPQARNPSFSLENNQLDESVGAVLEGIHIPRYRRL